MSRKRNWRQYNKSLVQRGSITFLLDPRSFKPMKNKGIGRPQLFSEELVTMLMMTKIHFHLTYRALQGFAESIIHLSQHSFSVPTYSSICKRAKRLKLPNLSSATPLVIALDATGVKVYGEGEWKVKVHGRSRRRKWVKLHIAVDPNSGEIVAEKTTTSNTHDGSMVQDLLRQVPGTLERVLADGAYDGKRSREAISKRGAQALIPPPKNARLWGKDSDRDEALRIICGLGRDKEARSLWGKLSGYSQRALVETAFSRMKGLFGARLFSKTFDMQRIENSLRCLILNRMNGLKA